MHLQDDPIALALLDGDGCIFHRDFVSKGREGGRECAALLLKCINSTADKVVGRNVSTVCHIFYNKQGLSRVLQVSSKRLGASDRRLTPLTARRIWVSPPRSSLVPSSRD